MTIPDIMFLALPSDAVIGIMLLYIFSLLFQIVVNVCVIDGLDGVRVGGLAGQHDFACSGKTVFFGDASKRCV